MAINVSTSKVDISLILTAINNAAGPLRAIKEQVEDIGTSAHATEQRLKAIQVVLAGIVVNKALELGKSFLETAANVEQLRLRLGFAVGSMHEATRLVDEIEHKFTGAGASAQKITNSMAELVEAGLPVDQAKKLAEAIGTVALTGKDADGTIASMSDTFTKLAVRGTADLRTLVGQLSTQMPRAVNIMAAEMGKTVAQFTADVKSGAITSQEIIDAFVSGVDKRLGDLLPIMRGTVRGAITLLLSTWDDAIRSLGNRTTINDEIVKRLVDVRHSIDNIVSNVTVDNVKQFFDTLDNIGNAAVKVGSALAPIVVLIAKLGSQAAELVSKLPTDVVAGGIIGYVFFGRAGALVAAGAVALFGQSMDQVEGRASSFISYVETYLPLGAIGLLLLGKKGALIAVAAPAILDYALTKTLLLLDKIVPPGAGETNFTEMNKKGATFFSVLLSQITKTGTDIDGLKGKVSETITGIGNALSNSTSVVKADKVVEPDAQKRVQEFIKWMNDLDGSFKTTSATTTAYDAVMAHYGELSRIAGQNVNELVMEARNLDAAVKASTGTLGGNATAADKLAKSLHDTGAAMGDVRSTPQFQAQMKHDWEDVTLKVQAAKEQYDKYSAAIKGDTLGQVVGDIGKKYSDHERSLREMQKAVTDFGVKYAQVPGVLDRVRSIQDLINAQIARGGTLRDDETNKAKALDALLQNRLLLEQRVLQARAAQQELELKQNFNNSPSFNLLSGTSAGQIINQVDQQRLQLQTQILTYEQQINTEQEKRINTNNPALIAQIDVTIQKYEQLKNKTQEAVSGLSANAVAQNQLWKSVGATIEQGLTNAITGLITRTTTLKDVGVQVFNALTQAAVKYMLQLAQINLLGNGSSGASGGLLAGLFNSGGGNQFMPTSSFLNNSWGFANGGVFSGGVTPFANGGIIGGPTLFGLAGEKGEEAIMPLERIGGKLGVRATGGGGDTYHVTVQAIDTQSGTEFLMKNIDTIGAGLTHQRVLNRYGRVK